MNLHGMVTSAISTVNPPIPVLVQISTGQGATLADGTRPPTYAPAITLQGQIQPITWKDLQQLDGINLQGIRWKIYLSGQIDGIIRVEKKGGDLINISPPNRHAGVWLVVQVLEQWPDWVVAAITLQDGA